MYNSNKEYINLTRRGQRYRLQAQHELLTQESVPSAEVVDQSVEDESQERGETNLSSSEGSEVTIADHLLENQHSSNSSGVAISLSSSSSSSSDEASSEMSNVSNLQLVEDKIEAAIINFALIQPRVSKKAIDTLLHQFNGFFPGVKMSSKTLLKARNFEYSIVQYEHGRYVSIPNWKYDLLEYISDHKLHDVKLQLNIDGTGVFNDSKKYNLYPVLIKILDMNKVLCSSFYLSETPNRNKFPHVNTVLRGFVDELKELILNGVVYDDTHCTVKVHSFVCDAPMREALKLIVGHNAYHACERCTQKGIYPPGVGHVVLDSCDAPPRTHEGFMSKQHFDHHKGDDLSILNELGIDMVKDFPLDYMHLCCIGIMKRILLRLKDSRKASQKRHLSPTQASKFEVAIKEISCSMPSEFNRKLEGGFAGLKHWKATEFRFFLLYGGFIALRNCVPNDQYLHFLDLAVAMRLMMSGTVEIEIVRTLLQNFFQRSKAIYGLSFVSYNVHSVIHLLDDFIRFGNLERVSTFPFENHLGLLKGRVMGTNKVLEQVASHVHRANAEKIDEGFKNPTKFDATRRNCGIILHNGTIGIIIEKKFDVIKY